jgi:hypothetical protein
MPSVTPNQSLSSDVFGSAIAFPAGTTVKLPAVTAPFNSGTQYESGDGRFDSKVVTALMRCESKLDHCSPSSATSASSLAVPSSMITGRLGVYVDYEMIKDWLRLFL